MEKIDLKNGYCSIEDRLLGFRGINTEELCSVLEEIQDKINELIEEKYEK